MRGRIEIAGGGLAGMAAAAALAQRGFEVRVHERRAELREEGGGIGLNEYALRALDVLGVTDDAMAKAARIRGADMRDHRGRRHMQVEFYAKAGRHYAVSRYELHRALMDAARAAGAEILTSSPVRRADANGVLVREDDTRFPADLVIAADGVGSQLRCYMAIQVRVRQLRHYGIRVALDYAMPEAKDEWLYERWNGTKRIGYVRMGDSKAAVYLSLPERDMPAPQRPIELDAWRRAFPQQAAIVEGVVEQGAQAAPLAEVVCSPWSNGRVVLIGDAAHTMPPHRGQGGALAIQDAVVLAQRLARLDSLADPAILEQALRGWESDVRPMVERTQRSSVLICQAQSWWPRPLLPLRPAFVRAVIRMKTPDLRGLAAPDHERPAAEATR